MNNNLILSHFGKAIPSTESLLFDDVNEKSMKFGYIVHPSVCQNDVVEYIFQQLSDYNHTFYKNWENVVSKTREELLLDQVRHYASTYGTDFTGNVYLPEGSVSLPEFDEYTLIMPITHEELIERIMSVLSSGIAMKQTTIEDYLTILDSIDHVIDITLVRNKEAKLILYTKLGVVPNNVDEFVRYLIYRSTGKTMLIQNSETINDIRRNVVEISDLIEKFGYEKLSESFLRYKNILLAFKTTKSNAKALNKLRRLAKTFHKPLPLNWFDVVLTDSTYLPTLIKNLDMITNFKKINLMQTINIRMKELDNRFFVVRNQKMFVKAGVVSVDKTYLKIVYDVLKDSLVKALAKKKCSVKMSWSINLTLPTSEKSFVGHYPLGTSVDYSDRNNIFGIHWKSADGANDLDLSIIDIDGTKYGWDASYKTLDNSLIYSGDMTSARPEATELFYAKKGFKAGLVNVNLYSGEPNSKFRFFLASEKIDKMTTNYMVNPSNVLFSVEGEMDSQQKILGVLTDTKFILANFRSGSGKVSFNSVTNLYTNYALDTIDCYIDMQSILEESGFELVENDAELDLTNPTKDILINLFS